MRLPEMTTRRMMVAVAIVAIMLGIVIATRRHFAFVKAAAREGRLEVLWIERAEEGEVIWGDSGRYGASGAEMEEMVAFGLIPHDRGSRALTYRQVANLHRARRMYYERAARYPWLPVTPFRSSP